jgi:hypothetical protein
MSIAKSSSALEAAAGRFVRELLYLHAIYTRNTDHELLFN